jgi:hypothetical protein
MITSTDDTPVAAGYRFADLSGHLNNDGVSSAPGLGAFNIWRNTLPADELPNDEIADIDGVPFAFPPTVDGAADNVCCDRQWIAVPPGRYDWLHVLAAAERRTEDWIHLHYAGGAVDPEWLRVSDFWPDAHARFGERLAMRANRMLYPRHSQGNMRPALWRQRVPVPREQDLVAIRLPDNPSIHIFAITGELSGGRA